MKVLALVLALVLCGTISSQDSLAKQHPKKHSVGKKAVKKPVKKSTKKRRVTHSARTVKKKHYRSARAASHSKEVKSKIVMPKQPEPEAKIEHHYPVPGGGGEDFNYDWYRNRAFPNDEIPPDAYSNALAQARKIPTLSRGGKFGTQKADIWSQIGPYTIGGRITSLATDPIDKNIFYAGAAAGGLWKTTDHGSNWRSLTDTFSAISVGCITIDPHDANTIYLGMGECNNSADSYPGNGIWKSTNAGDSWTSLGLEKTQYISKIIVDPTDKNIIYVSAPGPSTSSDSNRGVWKSIDGGASWSRVLLVRIGTSRTSTPVPVTDIVMNPDDHNDLVAALWQKYASISAAVNQVWTGLWRTRDGGETWKRIDTIAGSGFVNGITYKRLARMSLLWAPTTPTSTLWCVTSQIGKNAITGYSLDDDLLAVFKTTNPESGWVSVLDSSYRIPYGGNNVDSASLFYHQGGYNNFIVAHPKHPDEVYVGGIDVVRTSNGGASWTNITEAYPAYFGNDRTQHSDQHALAFTADESGTDLLNGQDGGVFNTRDFGEHWTRVEGLPITMLYHLTAWEAGMQQGSGPIHIDSLKLFGGTQDNGSISKGVTPKSDWQWINRGDGGQAQAHPTDPNILITSLQLGKIFVRITLDSLRPNLFSDAGLTDPNSKKWFDLSIIARRRGITDSSEPCAFIPPVLLDKERPTELYTGRTKVYRIKIDYNNPDSGTTIIPWSDQIAGNTTSPKAWYYGDVETIGIGARDSKGRPMLWAAGIRNGSRVVYRTVVDESRPDDVAPTWIRADSSGLPGISPAWIETDRSDSLSAFIGFSGFNNNGHLYKTIDGGKHWINISKDLPNAPINAFVIDSLAEHNDPSKKNQCIAVATDVGVYVTTNGGNDWYRLGEAMPNLVVGSLLMSRNWLIAGTHGRSVWAIDAQDLTAQSSVRSERIIENDLRIVSLNPNPASDEVHVALEGKATNSDVRVEFIDLKGNVIIRSYTNTSATTISIPANMPNGTYIIRATDVGGNSAEEKLIVKR